MIHPFLVLKREGALNDAVKEAFISAYGKRGQEAVEAVADGRVKKYNDYFVVVGNSGEYCVDGDFCSCPAVRYGNLCWHTLAVRIAEALNSYESYNLWYYKEGVDEEDESPK